MGLAFFDFDKTLVRKESGELIAARVGLRGLVHPWAGAHFLGAGILYKLGRVSRDAMQAIGYSTYRGNRLEVLEEVLTELWEPCMVPGLSPAVLGRLRGHQEQGHGTWVLTASPTYVAAPAMQGLSLDGVFGTDMEVGPDGRLTGVPLLPLMQGARKAEIIQQVAEERGVDLADCWAYSDSIADREMLEVVGNPVAVDPCRELRELAEANGWEVIGHDL